MRFQSKHIFIFSIYIFLNSFIPAFATTHIRGDIGGMTFSIDNSPYIVDSSLYLPPNSIAIIKDGCTFLFMEFTGLIIDGTLEVKGLQNSLVNFTSINDTKFNKSAENFPNPYSWNGITISEFAKEVTLRNFTVSYSVFGVKSNTESIEIENGYFYQNGQYNVTINGSLQSTTDGIAFNYNTTKDNSATTLSDKSTTDKDRTNEQTELDKALSDLADALLNDVNLAKVQKIAILPFENDVTVTKRISLGVSEYLVALIKLNPSVVIIDNEVYKKAMAMETNDITITNKNAVLELGRKMGADYIIAGVISNTLNRTIVNGQTLDVNLKTVITNSRSTFETDKLNDFTNSKMRTRGKVFSPFVRSFILPGWGQFYTGHHFRGVLYVVGASGGAGAISYLASKQFQYKEERKEFYNKSLDNSWKEFGDTAAYLIEYNRRNTKYTDYVSYTNYAIIGVACVWSVNILDAILSGVNDKRKTQFYFSAFPGFYNNLEGEFGFVYTF